MTLLLFFAIFASVLSALLSYCLFMAGPMYVPAKGMIPRWEHFKMKFFAWFDNGDTPRWHRPLTKICLSVAVIAAPTCAILNYASLPGFEWHFWTGIFFVLGILLNCLVIYGLTLGLCCFNVKEIITRDHFDTGFNVLCVSSINVAILAIWLSFYVCLIVFQLSDPFSSVGLSLFFTFIASMILVLASVPLLLIYRAVAFIFRAYFSWLKD